MTPCIYVEGRIVPIEVGLSTDLLDTYKADFYIYFILEGYLVLKIQECPCYLTSGTALFLKSSDSIQFIHACELKLFYIVFDAAFLNKSFSLSTANPEWAVKHCRELSVFFDFGDTYLGILPSHADDAHFYTGQYRKIYTQIHEQPDSQWSCRARMELLHFLAVAVNRKQELFPIHNEKMQFIQSVTHYVDTHIAERLSLNSLCTLFHTNRTTLSQEFKEYTSVTIREYIIRKRLVLACQALALTNLSVEEIAFKYGFFDISHFISIFKERHHMTPLQYRRQALENRKADHDATAGDELHMQQTPLV